MKGIGEQELALLRDVAAGAPATVGEVAERFGAPRGLARSTVLTVMERLREKGFLRRRRVDGVYRYAATLPPGELLRRLVGAFVDRSLGGSVSPFVHYLAERGEVSEAELRELESLVARLRDREPSEER